MILLQQDLEFVNEQSSFHRRTTAKWRDEDPRVKRHIEIAKKFEELAKKIESCIQNPPVKPQKAEIPGQLRLGNLDELPEELRSQIKISESDQLEIDIIESIQNLEGVAAIDEILVAIWHKTKVVQDRDFLSRKIYRMVQAGTIYSAPKKGFYQLDDPDLGASDKNTEDVDNTIDEYKENEALNSGTSIFSRYAPRNGEIS